VSGIILAPARARRYPGQDSAYSSWSSRDHGDGALLIRYLYPQ
jgi:hypothetical protein